MQLKKLKPITQITAISILCAILVFSYYLSIKSETNPGINPNNNLNLYKTTVVKINNKHLFQTYIADTPAKQQLGLMYQQELATDSAMLFTFANSTYQQFWMKNTLIPLDIIFVNDNKIVDIEHNAKPCRQDPCPTYNSEKPANQVLEINAGLSKKLNINIGQDVIVKN